MFRTKRADNHSKRPGEMVRREWSVPVFPGIDCGGRLSFVEANQTARTLV